MTYIILSIRPGSEDSTLQAIVILKVEVWLTSTNRCNILRTVMKDEHEIMLHFMLHNILSVDPVQGKEQNVHVWKMRSNGTTSTSRKRSFAILPSPSCRLQAKYKWQNKITVKDIEGMCLQLNVFQIFPKSCLTNTDWHVDFAFKQPMGRRADTEKRRAKKTGELRVW